MSQLILVGSPRGAWLGATPEGTEPRRPPQPAARLVAEASTWARRLLDPACRFLACGCPFPADLRRPRSPRPRVVSFYRREDRVVSPAACLIPEGRNVDVGGTHGGLVYNRALDRELARSLATPG